MRTSNNHDIWLAAGVRTPFAKVDGPLGSSTPSALRAGGAPHDRPSSRRGTRLRGVGHRRAQPHLEQHRPRSADGCRRRATVPAFSTVMACSTSMMGAIEAAGMIDGVNRNLALVGGVESLSRIQIGLGQSPVRLAAQVPAGALARPEDRRTSRELKAGDIRLYIPAIEQSHDRHQHGRAHRDHRQGMGHRPRGAGRDRAREPPARGRRVGRGLLRRPGDPGRRSDAATPFRARTRRWRSWRSCRRRSIAPAARARLTAGNSSPLTDGAAAFGSPRRRGLAKLPADTPRAKLVDWEIGSVDLRDRGPADGAGLRHPAPAGAQWLTYADIDLWEIHEAFAAQVPVHIKALESADFLRDKAGVDEISARSRASA